MRWRNVVFEILPLLLLPAWYAFESLALQVQADRPPNTETHLSTPRLREISAQVPRDAAALFAAADAIDLAGYTDKMPQLLESTERQLLAGSLGESVPMPATIGEAIELEKPNALPPLSFLRERAFKDLVEVRIAPRANGEPAEWTSGDGQRHLHVADAIWRTEKGVHSVRADILNRSRRSLRGIDLSLVFGHPSVGGITLHCSSATAQPPSGEPREWRPNEKLPVACAPGYGVRPEQLQPALERAEIMALHPVPERVMFSDAPFWIERLGGAQVPQAWPVRPKTRVAEVPKLAPRPCEVAGTCRDLRWVFDVFLRTTGQNAMVKLFLLAMMTGLITCAVARRIFKGEARFRPARRWIYIAGIFVAALLFMRGEFAIVALPFAALAYAGWLAGFRTGAWAFREEMARA